MPSSQLFKGDYTLSRTDTQSRNVKISSKCIQSQPTCTQHKTLLEKEKRIKGIISEIPTMCSDFFVFIFLRRLHKGLILSLEYYIIIYHVSYEQNLNK